MEIHSVHADNHGTLPCPITLKLLHITAGSSSPCFFSRCLDRADVVSPAMSLKDFYPDWDLERGVFESGKLPKPLGPELQAFEPKKH